LKEDYIRPLLSIGPFDELVTNRKQALIQLEGKIQNITYSGGSLDLLETMALKEAEVADYDLEQKLALEEEYLGVYLSGHPVQQYQKLQQLKQTIAIADLVPNERVRILFYVRQIREIRTKKGEQMAFLEGTDASKEVSITVFPTLYRHIRSDVAENAVLYVEGKVEVSRYNGEIQLIADKIELAEKAQAQLTDQTCYLKITRDVETNHLQELSQLLRKHRGRVPVVLFYESNGKKVLLTEENWLKKDEEMERKLGHL
ncbi:DNA polymerase III subunit alpha, partial [Escherichia coli]